MFSNQRRLESISFGVVLVVTAAVTYTLVNAGREQNMVILDQKSRTAIASNNVSNEYLLEDKQQRNSTPNLKDTITDTDVADENMTEFIKKRTTTPIMVTTIRMDKGLAEKIEITNMNGLNNTKEYNHTVSKIPTFEENEKDHNKTELIQKVTKTLTSARPRTAILLEKLKLRIIPQTKALIRNVTQNEAVKNKELRNTKSDESVFKLNPTPPMNSTDQNISTLTTCAPAVIYTGKIRKIELNQTYTNITNFEEDNNYKFCIGLSASLIGICLITITILCLCHFKRIKMIRRRAEEEKNENYQNFCISAAAEQMASVEAKLESISFGVVLVVTAVYHQVLINAGREQNMVILDQKSRTAIASNNVSNEYLLEDKQQRNSTPNLKDTITDTDVADENMTEFIKKRTTTPIMVTTIRMDKGLAEKIEITNMNGLNNTKEYNHTVSKIPTFEENEKDHNKTELIQKVTKTLTSARPRTAVTQNEAVKNKELRNTKSDESVFKLNPTPPMNSTDQNISTLTTCAPAVIYTGKIRKIEITYINTTSCESYHFHKLYIGLTIIFAGICLITISICCIWHFKPMKMIRKRLKKERTENYQNFCISAAAERMVSVEEKFSQH
ncbi:hypothetical protein T4C_10308 [Trichinella pseudospiralis]|uniref:Transmembrane protein n=1 Tax=Trichinella pseudospiralis TaxID=6337 RepID=A0A0V1JGM7_TRIPS|nr:hypothetical protein T4C_10308 [Trichinella pseudospiralis]